MGKNLTAKRMETCSILWKAWKKIETLYDENPRADKTFSYAIDNEILLILIIGERTSISCSTAYYSKSNYFVKIKSKYQLKWEKWMINVISRFNKNVKTENIQINEHQLQMKTRNTRTRSREKSIRANRFLEQGSDVLEEKEGICTSSSLLVKM